MTTKSVIFSGLILLGGLLVLSVIGSNEFHPDPSADESFMARAEGQTAAGVKVRASALSPEESRRSFGEDLARYNIQPLWLSIENNTQKPLHLLPAATDPAYYSPYEVAYRFHGVFSSGENRKRDSFFLERQIKSVLEPHSVTTGFIYTVLDAGMKFAPILIAGEGRQERFEFVLRIPGARFLGQKLKTESPYPPATIEDVDLSRLRELLQAYPCCTTDASGSRNGDPLNIAIVESASDAIAAVASRNWHLVETLDVGSIIETARAFLFQDPYLTSPVSPLYLFGRKEDFALQKSRSTIDERIHLRLWLAPERYRSRRVWVGQISRDIGVELTDKTWNLTTHKIGPDVDFDRFYLLQDLLLSGFLDRFGYIPGVGPASSANPRTNLTGDKYYTDGLRLVLFLSDRKTTLEDVRQLPWDHPHAAAQVPR